MSENIKLQLQVHYELFKSGDHKMDAKIFNECERQFLKGLDTLKPYIGDFDVKVEPKEKGGIIDTFLVSLVSVVAYNLVESLTKAFVERFFPSKLEKSETTKNNIDILEKIKKGNLTREEALQLVSNDKKLLKLVSNYYKSLDQEPEVVSVSCSAKNEIENEPFVKSKIPKADFIAQIIANNTEEETKEETGTTIHILSPVLQKGHGTTWRGFHSGKTIDFKIQDKDFLKQVYNNEIKFGSNTVITCNLITHTKHVAELDGLEEDKYSYVVKDVTHWRDDDNFRAYTKSYKKIRHGSKELNLFPDQEDDKKER